MTNRQIAHTMGIPAIWVKKIWAKYKHAGRPSGLSFRSQMGRPPGSIHGRREQSTVTCTYYGCLDAGSRWQTMRHSMEESTGMTIPYGTIRKVMRDEELSERQPNKSRRRKWVRYERRYSNSLWHTDYKQLTDGRWFLAYMDDASRFITGYGVFDSVVTRKDNCSS